MSALVTNNTRVFNANQFLNAFQKQSVSLWDAGVNYVIGDVVQYSLRKYIATNGGTSGATPPTHTSGAASDGVVSWLYVEDFVDTSYFDNSMYLCIGKNTPWYDFTGVIDWADSIEYTVGSLVSLTGIYYEAKLTHTGDGAANNSPDIDATNWRVVTAETPMIAENDFINTNGVLNDIISGKKIQSGDVSLAVKRINWTSGTFYSMFNPEQDDFAYANDFYVYNSEGNLYKCLDNNNDVASTSEPTGTSDYVTTVDGYTWKYMASTPTANASSTYVPVKYKLVNDASSQYNTQTNANPFEVSAIVVTNGGTGYTSPPTVTITPTGGDTVTGATAVAVMNGTSVDYIQITNPGSGYKNIPTIGFTGDGADAAATAVQSPKDGNGSNVLIELDARYALISMTLNEDESTYFPIDSADNVFRQITIIVDPIDTLATTTATSTTYIGPTNEDFVGDGVAKREFLDGSGKLLYIENVAPVTRTTGQTEDIKIVLKF